MTRYRPEIAFAAILLCLLAAIWHWQAPGSRLTDAEVERYTEQIDRLAPMPSEQKAAFLAHLRAWGKADDGKSVHMLNLMRFHDQLQPWPGTTVVAESPRAANEHYEDAAVGMALPMGLSMAFAGEIQGVDAATHSLMGGEQALDQWDRVLVVRYPNRRAFFELISNPDYIKVMPYKFAALDVVLIPLSAMTLTPDPRLIVVIVGLILLLTFGWFRAARRARVQR